MNEFRERVRRGQTHHRRLISPELLRLNTLLSHLEQIPLLERPGVSLKPRRSCEGTDITHTRAVGVKTTLFFHSLQTEKEIRNIPLVNMIFKKPRYKYREGAKINDGAPQWGCGSVHLHDNRGTGGQNRERGAKKKEKKKWHPST